MKRTFTITLIGLISMCCGIMAQDYKKEWRDGKLTWADFIERTGEKGVSELRYFFGYNTGSQEYNNIVVKKYIVQAYVDRNLSWVDPQYKTEQYLRYNQVIFNIIEIHRRRLQAEVDRVGYLFEIEGKFNIIQSSCTNEIDKFQWESSGGHNFNSIVFWEQKTSYELNVYSEKLIPEFENRSFGYALHAGLGGGYFTGSIGEYFNPSFNFIFGFDFAYKKSILYLNGTLAGCKVKKDYFSDKNWYEKQNVGLAIIDVSYGYAFLDNKKLKLSPFVGLGITELTGQNKDNKEAALRLVDYNVIFGLNADYKIRTTINIAPNMGVKEKVETSIRTRLYITKADFAPDLNGYSINLTVGLCGFGNMIRVK